LHFNCYYNVKHVLSNTQYFKVDVGLSFVKSNPDRFQFFFEQNSEQHTAKAQNLQSLVIDQM